MTPIPSATLILLRDTDDGVKTLLLRRNSKSRFLGGCWVFPGGVVEEGDAVDGEIETACNAAVRETAEEAGIAVDASAILPISLWVTPEGAPKRFSTWFFVGGCNRADFCLDGHEVTKGEWVGLQEAISRHHAGEIEIMPPTLVSLMSLLAFGSTQNALDYYRNRKPRSYFSRAVFQDKQLVMLYPGDAAYESGDTNLTGRLHRCLQTDNGWEYINEAGESW